MQLVGAGAVAQGLSPRAYWPAPKGTQVVVFGYLYSLVVPFRGRHAVKVGYSRVAVTEFGTEFRQFLVCYAVLIR
jgi:hypothetical protein